MNSIEKENLTNNITENPPNKVPEELLPLFDTSHCVPGHEEFDEEG